MQTFALQDGAAATSGDYEVYFDKEQVYHHLIDPHAALPARGSRSVTVVAASATLADAFSTAIFVAGPKNGKDLIETLPGVECLLVAADGARVTSRRWPAAGSLFVPS